MDQVFALSPFPQAGRRADLGETARWPPSRSCREELVEGLMQQYAKQRPARPLAPTT